MKREEPVSDTYLKDLRRAYEEDTVGEWLFLRLPYLASDAQAKAQLRTFVELEVHIYTAVKPLIDHYRLKPRVTIVGQTVPLTFTLKAARRRPCRILLRQPWTKRRSSRSRLI